MSQAHAMLRSATGPDHVATEEAFAPFDLAEPHGYRSFLHAQAAAVLPLEAWLDRTSAARALPDWARRRRGHLLLADLEALGVPQPDWDMATLPGDPLGAVYVLEGSRFGGRLLARRVGAAEGATRFLRDPGVAGGWTRLWDTVERELAAQRSSVGAMIEAARAAFALFRAAAEAGTASRAPIGARGDGRAAGDSRAARP